MGIMPYFTPFRSVIEPHRAKKRGYCKGILGIVSVVFCLFASTPATANSYPHTVEIAWTGVENAVLAHEYEWQESSHLVRFLQGYVLRMDNPDGVYGPKTNRLHRQIAMERLIHVPLYNIYIPDQDFGPAVEQWRSTVLDAILAYGGPASDVPRFLHIMRCESGGDPEAYNQASGASGLMQHLDNYFPWRAKMAGFEGASPFDGVANIYTSAWLIYAHTAGGWQHWVCQ